jgi:acetyltransferase-like isoleucine patch superfamily enzyme
MTSDNTRIAKGVAIPNTTTIGQGVRIDRDVIIEPGTVILENVHVKRQSIIGAHSIIGHRTLNFWSERSRYRNKPTIIGEGSWIRSGTIIYCGNRLEPCVQTGNNVAIREDNYIGRSTVIGTGVSMQKECRVGRYVRVMNDTHITNRVEIGDYAFLGPHVSTMDDKYMGAGQQEQVPPKIMRGARIGGHAVLLPGVVVGEQAVVGAGAVVTKNVEPFTIVLGIPARPVGKVPDDQHLNEDFVRSKGIFLHLGEPRSRGARGTGS